MFRIPEPVDVTDWIELARISRSPTGDYVVFLEGYDYSNSETFHVVVRWNPDTPYFHRAERRTYGQALAWVADHIRRQEPADE